MYLSTEQTRDAEILIRLNCHGFVATARPVNAALPTTCYVSETVVVPLAQAERAEYFGAPANDQLLSEIIETARRAGLRQIEFIGFDILPMDGQEDSE